ncbi:hypothetical protein [Bacillus massilinigeriensis]|uniref:hypothetical protein n=1 Tax=Bacillus mediterraneensis TaxID=1805474 RepID=UPI0008F90626|nr:hypothetical protein [Bacillus mediterraneensis]
MKSFQFWDNTANRKQEYLGMRPYPPVDSSKFRQSAGLSLAFFKDARSLLEKISASPSFSTKIMKAAQESKTQAVERLILSTGIRNKPMLLFNPDNLMLRFLDEKGDAEVIVKLKWR